MKPELKRAMYANMSADERECEIRRMTTFVREIVDDYELSEPADFRHVLYDISVCMKELVDLRLINPVDSDSNDFLGIDDEDARIFEQVAYFCDVAADLLKNNLNR